MNPLFNSLFGSPKQQAMASPAVPTDMGKTTQNVPQMTIQDALAEIHSHPAEVFQKAGFNVPQECIGNNQAVVMHLLRSGQVGGPMMRMIAPILGRLGVR